MKTILLGIKNKEDGVTLVELLAAIAILSIIVTSFLAFFIQSANTNKQTNEVNEATFIAQGIMEEVTYYSSQDYTVGATEDAIAASEISFPYTLEIKKVDGSSLYQVIVTVSEGSKARAKMETRLPFNED